MPRDALVYVDPHQQQTDGRDASVRQAHLILHALGPCLSLSKNQMAAERRPQRCQRVFGGCTVVRIPEGSDEAAEEAAACSHKTMCGTLTKTLTVLTKTT